VRTYLIFGIQGSGKSTLAPYIAKKLGVSYLSTGQLFREEMEKKTSLGNLVRDRMNRGILIDDETTWEMLEPYLRDHPQGVLLDGFPRNLNQAEFLEKKGLGIDKVFYLNLPEDLASERLIKRGRDDDTKEGIVNRINLFKEQTLPVFAYYQKSGVEVVTIDNTPKLELVQKSIDDYLKN
jgi:adenylate kinase